jgi:protein-tyrosine phosphatase
MSDQSPVHSLVGVQNFRAVGGFRTRDGGRVRNGQIWRSARLDQVTHADCEQIVSLGIRVVADLRTALERTTWPTNPALLGRVRHLCWDLPDPPTDTANARQTLRERLRREEDQEQLREVVAAVYAQIAESHATLLRGLYLEIASGDSPILIHCSAGKDRTGVAIALLLDVLHVDRPDILDNYALSEDLLDWARLDVSATLGAGASASEDIPPTVRSLLLRSDRRYLQAVFDQIEQRYGSTERFLPQIGVSPDAIARLRQRLVET